MATEWTADIKKYAPEAEDSIVASIVRHCGGGVHDRWGTLMSFHDPAEIKQVRDSFLRKTLGLSLSDSDLDQGIAAVERKMTGQPFKTRVTVYYLLASHYERLIVFAEPKIRERARMPASSHPNSPSVDTFNSRAYSISAVNPRINAAATLVPHFPLAWGRITSWSLLLLATLVTLSLWAQHR